MVVNGARVWGVGFWRRREDGDGKSARWNGHNNLARMVLLSSPVRGNGSTLNFAPSISPTSSSAFAPSDGPPGCVPPVMRSVFSGIESLGTKPGSTDVSSSGGALSAPTLGISLAMVELVLVMWGPAGLDCWVSRHEAVLSCWRVSARRRGMEVERGRNAVEVGRARREARRRSVIVWFGR